MVQTREIIRDEYNLIFICEIIKFVIFRVIISQQKCHILSQDIQENTKKQESLITSETYQTELGLSICVTDYKKRII